MLGFELGWCGRGCCVNSGRSRVGISACAGAAERGVGLSDWNCHDVQPGISALQTSRVQHVAWLAAYPVMVCHISPCHAVRPPGHRGTHQLAQPGYFILTGALFISPHSGGMGWHIQRECSTGRLSCSTAVAACNLHIPFQTVGYGCWDAPALNALSDLGWGQVHCRNALHWLSRSRDEAAAGTCCVGLLLRSCGQRLEACSHSMGAEWWHRQ